MIQVVFYLAPEIRHDFVIFLYLHIGYLTNVKFSMLTTTVSLQPGITSKFQQLMTRGWWYQYTTMHVKPLSKGIFKSYIHEFEGCVNSEYSTIVEMPNQARRVVQPPTFSQMVRVSVDLIWPTVRRVTVLSWHTNLSQQVGPHDNGYSINVRTSETTDIITDL